MIIKYPTGFYKNVLPSVPSDSTSVTFTISNSLPPRSSLVFPKLPTALEQRKLHVPVKSSDASQYGALAFTITKAAPSNIISGVKAVDLGDVIEFEDAATQLVAPMLVSLATEVRHDLNKYDLSAVGVDQELQDEFLVEIKKGQEAVRNNLNAAVQNRADSMIEIDRLNKLRSETDKTRNASIYAKEAMGASDVLDRTIAKLTEELAVINKKIDDEINRANTFAETADDLRLKYLTLCRLVN